MIKDSPLNNSQDPVISDFESRLNNTLNAYTVALEYPNNKNLKPEDIEFHKQSIIQMEKMLDENMSILGDEHPNTAITLNGLGGLCFAVGDYKKAIECFEKTLIIHKKIYGENHENVAASLNNIGKSWGVLGDYEKAVSYHESALSIIENISSNMDAKVIPSLNFLGAALCESGQYNIAISYIERAERICVDTYGVDSWHTTKAIKLHKLTKDKMSQ